MSENLKIPQENKIDDEVLDDSVSGGRGANYVMQRCPSCKQIVKVTGGATRVRCPSCKKFFGVSISNAVEQSM